MIPNPVILYSMWTNKNNHKCTFEKRDILAWIRHRHVWYLLIRCIVIWMNFLILRNAMITQQEP